MILNDSLSSTIMSSVTLILRHTELLTDVVEEIVRSSSARGLKSLTPEKEKVIVEESHTCPGSPGTQYLSFNNRMAG